MLEIGSPAPDFTLPDHLGNEIHLQDLRGSWVVLWWFPKASTSTWTLEGRGFRERSPQFASRGARILGASFDPPNDNLAFAEAEGFDFSLLSDVERTAGSAYGVVRAPGAEHAALPQRRTFLIDPDQRLAHIYEVTDVRGHPDQVLADIDPSAAAPGP